MLLIEEEKEPSCRIQHQSDNPSFDLKYLTNAEVYKNYTRTSYDVKRAKKQVEGFLSISHDLALLNILKSIGYDGNNVETFLLFQSYFNQNLEQNADTTKKLKTALRFIGNRKRAWQVVFFYSTNE